MNVKSLFAPAAVSVLLAIAFILANMPAPWNVFDQGLEKEGFWQSSSITEPHKLKPTWRALGIVAEIASVRDSMNIIPDIHPGEVITGTCIFDLHAVDSAIDDPDVGNYRFSNSPFGVILTAGKYTFGTNPRLVDFEMEVGNHDFGDTLLFMSRNNLCQPRLRNGDRSGDVGLIWWQIHDFTGTALTSDRLPTALAKETDWKSLVGLRIEGTVSDRKSKSEGSFLIVANVIRTETIAPGAL
jgi:hypothetical protein